MAYQQPYGPPQSSGMLMGAGILNILNALIAFGFGVFSLVGFSFFFFFGGIVFWICGILLIVGGIFSLLAAIYCFKRVNYGMAVAGTIIGMILGGSLLFGIIALILVVVGKNDFLDQPRPPVAYAPAQPYQQPYQQQYQQPYQQPPAQAPPPAAAPQFCRSCGASLPPGANNCPSCGAPTR